jgi:uncharacterized protein (TIGR03435 family)
MTGVGVAMPMLCWNLAQILGRTVVDKTGLQGFYDFKLEYAMLGPVVPVTDGSDPGPHLEGPSISSALREQLGLRLEGTKGPVEMFIIDRIEKPTAN